MSRKSSKGRVVRRTLADGSVKTYRYAPYKGPRKRSDTLSDLLDAWESSPEWSNLRQSTQDWYTRSVLPLAGMGNVPAAKVSRREVTDIRNALAKARGNGAATAFVRAASAVFGWAVENGWLEHSPIARMKRLKGGHLPAWTEADLALALAHLPEHLRRVVILAVYTGQRRGDLIAMNWEAYGGGGICLTQQKTPTKLVIPCLPPRSRARAERLVQRDGNAAAYGADPD